MEQSHFLSYCHMKTETWWLYSQELWMPADMMTTGIGCSFVSYIWREMLDSEPSFCFSLFTLIVLFHSVDYMGKLSLLFDIDQGSHFENLYQSKKMVSRRIPTEFKIPQILPLLHYTSAMTWTHYGCIDISENRIQPCGFHLCITPGD